MAHDFLIRLDDDVTQLLTMAAEALHRAPSEIVHDAIVDTNVLPGASSRAELDIWRDAVFMFTIANDKSQNRTCLYLIVELKTSYRTSAIEEDAQLWEEWINAALRNTIDRWHVSPGDVEMTRLGPHGAPALPKKPRPKGIGKYHSGHCDTSQRVDELVADMLDERYPRYPKSP